MATSDPIVMPSTISLAFSYHTLFMSIPYDCTRTFFPASSDHSRRFLPLPHGFVPQAPCSSLCGFRFPDYNRKPRSGKTRNYLRIKEGTGRKEHAGWVRLQHLESDLPNAEQYISDLWLLRCLLKTCIYLPVHALHRLKPALSK
jgi:hypothetical protein